MPEEEAVTQHRQARTRWRQVCWLCHVILYQWSLLRCIACIIRACRCWPSEFSSFITISTLVTSCDHFNKGCSGSGHVVHHLACKFSMIILWAIAWMIWRTGYVWRISEIILPYSYHASQWSTLRAYKCIVNVWIVCRAPGIANTYKSPKMFE